MKIKRSKNQRKRQTETTQENLRSCFSRGSFPPNKKQPRRDKRKPTRDQKKRKPKPKREKTEIAFKTNKKLVYSATELSAEISLAVSAAFLLVRVLKQSHWLHLLHFDWLQF